jgi:predicted PurR-regulated permease PerM
LAEFVIPCPTWKEVKPWLYRVAGILLVVYVAYLIREIWLPLLLAFLIALVLDPVVDRMERRGFSRTVAAAIIFGSFIVAFVGLVIISVPVFIEQAGGIQQRIGRVLPDQTPAGIDKALIEQGVSPTMRTVIESIVTNARASFNRSSSLFSGHILEYATNLIWLAIIPIVAFYALRDFHLILGKALLLVKRERRTVVQSAVAEVTAIFAKYMRGLLVVSALNGLATWILLQILGVPSAFLLGVVAGVLYSVPYIGALLTVVLISVMSLISGGVNYMLVVLGANIVLHQIIFDQIVTPRIVGGHVGLHPILAIVALLAGNALLGLLGMILAVPVAACIQIGVLGMVPKLKQEIDLPGGSETAAIAHETKETQLKVDATEELHTSVTNAVETIEGNLTKDDERREELLKRRRKRAGGTGQQSA